MARSENLGECSPIGEINHCIGNENQTESDDGDCQIIGFKSKPKPVPLVEIKDECVKEDKKDINPKKKENSIISHIDHNTKTVQRKLLCVDCDTRICPICFENLTSHLKHHIFYSENCDYRCSTCEVSFRTSCGLVAHENLHKEAFPLVCPECGAIYQQTKYFINHCMNRCSHLFKKARYMCSACDDTFKSRLEHEQHTKQHVITKYYCRICRRDLGALKKPALLHLEEKHNIILTPKTATFALDVSTFCNMCYKIVPHDHFKTHVDIVPTTVLFCPCGTKCSTHIFRQHKNSCPSGNILPKYWKHNLAIYKHKNCDDTDSKTCIKCGCISGSSITCETCSKRADESIESCPQCKKKKIINKLTNMCEKCSISRSKTICRICALRFEFKVNQVICDACTEKRGVESDWLGGQLVVDDIVDSFATCELTYDDNSPDHKYCLRQEFVSKLKKPQQSCHTKDACAVKSTVPPQNDYPLTISTIKSSDDPTSITCHLCDKKLQLPGNLLYRLLLHINRFHANAVIPTVTPPGFKHNNIEELDLMSRMKIIEENKQNIKDELLENDFKPPARRMRLYDPKKMKTKTKTVLDNYSNVNEQKENDSEFISDIEIQTPPKKEHEFWDHVYEALSVVNKKDVPQSKIDVVYENLSGYSSKRQVKKPLRLVEQEDNKQQSLSKKGKGDNESESSTPEKLIIKDSNTREDSSTDESDLIIIEKRKKKRGFDDIDLDLAKVKQKLKNDNELEFIAKTFSENIAPSPNKRKRKLASKLVFNKAIDVLSGKDNQPIGGSDYICSICNALISNRQEFKQHLLTHQKEETPLHLQRMKCDESLSQKSAPPIFLNQLEKLYLVRKVGNNKAENRNLTDVEASSKKNIKGILNDNEHKCKVCYQMFPSALELSKHFRIHGLAFIKQAQKDVKLT